MASIRIASICPRMVPADSAANFDTMLRWATRAAKDGADLALFPELFLPGYPGDAYKTIPAPIRARFLAEATSGPGPVIQRLAACADALDLHLCIGLLERDGGQRYNTQVLIAPGRGCIARYRKLQVAAREAWFSDPGNDFPVCDLGGISTGMLICRDKAFPEIARILALNGAHLLLNPHATLDSDQQPFRQWSLKLCTARAMENGCYLIANNSIVEAPSISPESQAGYTFAIDPWGHTIHCDNEPGDTERMAMITIDSDVVARRRAAEGVHFNLQSRRPGAYGRLVEQSLDDG